MRAQVSGSIAAEEFLRPAGRLLCRQQLHALGHGEDVEGAQPRETPPSSEHHGQVPREGRRLARDVDDGAHRRCVRQQGPHDRGPRTLEGEIQDDDVGPAQDHGSNPR